MFAAGNAEVDRDGGCNGNYSSELVDCTRSVADGLLRRDWSVTLEEFLRVSLSSIPLGVASTSEVSERLCLPLVSLVAAGNRSLVLLDVHGVSSSSGPENLQPPTPSKSRSMPALAMMPKAVVSKLLDVIGLCSDPALLALLLRFFLHCWGTAGDDEEPFTDAREWLE